MLGNKKRIIGREREGFLEEKERKSEEGGKENIKLK